MAHVETVTIRGPQNGLNYSRLKEEHPCFGRHPANSGRIHLPVSPACNIQCKFCDRKINDTEDRPGVTQEVISPAEASGIIDRALELCPQVRVVGIAGPGDSLASDSAFETFSYVEAHHPELLKCMSTNGLLLAERAQEVIDAGIDTITVTVNAVDPKVGVRINDTIFYHGRRYYGLEAAQMLIDNQLEGIRRVVAAGIVVKVNTVLVPGVNDRHIRAVAKAVSEAGASIINIIPLIPQHEFADKPAPTCAQIMDARLEAALYLDVFTHCQHCRADAIGIPGKTDVSRRVYGERRVRVRDTFSHG